MRTRGFFFVLLLVAAAAALFESYRLETQVNLESIRAATRDRDLQSVRVALGQLRGAEAGFVAPGQDPGFWVIRATELASDLEVRLDALRDTSSSPDTIPHYQAAATALAEVVTADRHARIAIGANQLAEAGRAVFQDAHGAGDRVDAEVAAAADAERSSFDARILRLSRVRMAVMAGALALAVIVAAVLVRIPRSVSAPAAVDAESDTPRETSSTSLSTSPAGPPAAAPGSLLSLKAEPHEPAPLHPQTALSINLQDVAQLCVDFARVVDGDDVPPLLERAAKVLRARGVVLWVTETSGRTLRPLLQHGYSDKVMQRLGPMAADADNVTSLAYRSRLPQVINASSLDGCGAIAVPILTPTSCIGVLSAEIKHARPDRETLSVARVLAAQLAALAAPIDESAAPANQAAEA